MAQGFALATAGRASSNIGSEISESASARHSAPADHLLKSGNCHVVGDRSSLDILARAEQHNAASLSSLHHPGRGFHAEARIPQGSVVKDGGATYLSFGPDSASETTTGKPTLKGLIQQIDRSDRTPTGAESLPGSLPTEQSGGESKAVQPTRAQYGGEVPSMPMIKPETPMLAEPPKDSQNPKPLDANAEFKSVVWDNWNTKLMDNIKRSMQSAALSVHCDLDKLSPYVDAHYTFVVDRSGRVSNITQLKPSGDAALDKAIQSGIRNADIPEFPKESDVANRTIPYNYGPGERRHVPSGQVEQGGVIKPAAH
jgi:TonB family protein